MTLREAEQHVDECECQVINTYNNFLDAAKGIEKSADDAVFKERKEKKLAASVFCIAGIMLLFTSHQILGVILIICGAVGIYTSYKEDIPVQKNVLKQCEEFNLTLSKNSKI